MSDDAEVGAAAGSASGDVFKEELLSIKGQGSANVEGQSVDVSFTGKLRVNGVFEGSLAFPNTWVKEFLTATNPAGRQELLTFEISGKIVINKKESPFIMRRCFFTSARSSFGGAEIVLNADFVAQEVVIDEAALDEKLTKELAIGFELANVSRTLRVIVETKLGTLTLRHSKDIEALEAFMDSYGAPMITSQADLTIKTDGSKKLGEVLDEASRIVENFLKITSLAQGVWHTWVAVSVYQKLGSGDEYERIFLKIRHPKLMSSAGRSITNIPHSPNFINAAWKGYSDEVNSKYGFDLALEWYIGASGGGLVETKFLSGTTCLELLLDRYSTESDTEFYLPKKKFAVLGDALRQGIEEWSKAEGLDEPSSKGLQTKVQEINRRSYATKATQLLEFWKVKTDDLDITIQDIIAIRNEITHTGGIKSDKYKDKVIPAYIVLREILVRLFLAMLQYDDQYFSQIRGKLISFSEVHA